MLLNPWLVRAVAAALTLTTFAPPARAAMVSVAEETSLHTAYFHEHQSKDYAKAKSLYDEVAARSRDAEAKALARAGSARCRDALAARRFATLMPPNAVAFVELNRPGKLLAGLADMMGLTKSDIRDLLAKRPGSESAAPFYIPKEIAVSPSLLEAISAFGGAAVALTEIDLEGGPPSGIAVVHHGDLRLLKGLLETAFQFAPTGETIREMPTFAVRVPEVGLITGVLTESLLIVGTDKVLVEDAVDRLTGKSKTSLATREDLKDSVGGRPDGTLFAFANLQEIFKLVREQAGEHDVQDLRIANAIADLDNLRWATFSAGITDGALGLEFAVRYADGHHSIAYNLLRLPPMTRECLRLVPPDAAAVFGLGLNPALTGMVADAARPAKDGQPADITGFDIPREFFGNVREICAFVVPGAMTTVKAGGDDINIPNVGVLLAVNNVEKSKALWDQVFTIPGLVAGAEPVPPKPIRIGTTDAKAYTIPDVGQIYMADLGNCIAIGATRTALKGAVRAHNKKESIVDDDVMGAALARMPKDTTILAAAHVGRLAETAAGALDRDEAMAARIAAGLCDKMVVSLGVGQSPVQLTLHASVTGLPDVNKALTQFGPMINGAAGIAMRAQQQAIEAESTEARRIRERRNQIIEEQPEASREKQPAGL